MILERHNFKVMVSGAISWWGKSRLVLMEKGVTIDAKEYLDTLKNYHIPDMHDLFEGYGFVWQQVSSYASRLVACNNVNVISCM